MISQGSISGYKVFYRNIGNVECSYFNNERVYFNKKGFDHMIRKRGSRRFSTDQSRRLPLLKYCKEILGGKYYYVEKRIFEGKRKRIYFWGFMARISDTNIKLVVRQFGNGSKHFLSIFPLKH